MWYPEAWVATGHVGGWRIAGDLSLWQVCLRISRRLWTNSPTPRCHVWLALIRAEGVNGKWVMCPNGASGKPGDIPEYVALHWHRELCQCRPLFLPHAGYKMDTKKKIWNKQGAATTADLSQQELHEEVVALTWLNFKAFWGLKSYLSDPEGWKEKARGSEYCK
jgi:hypothetical protein